MENIERYIFDLDGTLWEQDFIIENYFFKGVLSDDEYLKFIKVKGSLFAKYELIYSRHNILWLSKFLIEETGINFTEDILNDWLEFNSSTRPLLYEGATQLLENLKYKDKIIVAKSNRYREEQYARLKNVGILEYFDEVYGGDSILKPRVESYIEAAGDTPISKCVMIGDNLEKDVLAPRRVGMKSIYYNPDINDEEVVVNPTVKSLIKIKDLYN